MEDTCVQYPSTPHDYDLFEDRSPVRGCNREVKRDLGGPER